MCIVTAVQQGRCGTMEMEIASHWAVPTKQLCSGTYAACFALTLFAIAVACLGCAYLPTISICMARLEPTCPHRFSTSAY
jgi:hypothetical protein